MDKLNSGNAIVPGQYRPAAPDTPAAAVVADQVQVGRGTETPNLIPRPAAPVNTNGLRCGSYLRPEPFFSRKTQMVFHAGRSGNNPTGVAEVPYGKYKIIATDQLLDSSKEQMLIGFGQPKVTALVSQGKGYVKLNASAFFKRDARVGSGETVQSGYFIRPRDLSADAYVAMRKAMNDVAGHRSLSSARATAKALTKAGFTSGGKKIGSALPYRLFVRLAEHGLEYNGKKVEFDIISTTPQTLEEHFRRVKHNEAGTILNPLKPSPTDTPDGGVPTDKPSEQPPNGQPAEGTATLRLRNSRPNLRASMLRGLIGAHVLWEILPDQKQVDINAYLPESLKDKFHTEKKLSRGDKIKKVLFSPPKVAFLRRNMAKAFDEQQELFSPQQLMGMMRVPGDGEEVPADKDGLIKYNLVICGDKSPRGARVVIARLKVGKDKPDDILSKHVLMAGYDPDVRFAGSLWAERVNKEDGTVGFRLHIKGDSGSYTPKAHHAEGAAEYLRKAMPGVEVVVHPVELPPPTGKPDYLRTYAVTPQQLTAMRSNLNGLKITLHDGSGHATNFRIRRFKSMQYQTEFYDTGKGALLQGGGMLRARITQKKPGDTQVKDVDIETKIPSGQPGDPYQLRRKGASYPSLEAWRRDQTDALGTETADSAVRLARTVAGENEPLAGAANKDSIRELYLVSPTTPLIGRFKPSFFVALDSNSVRAAGSPLPNPLPDPQYHVLTPGVFSKLPWTKKITPARVEQLEDLCNQLSGKYGLTETKESPYAEAMGYLSPTK